MSLLVKKAYEIARNAHFGQKDKAGVDYIKHPETVANLVQTDEQKIVAYLHDVVEDTALTLDDLMRHGFPNRIISAVDALTKKDGQSYQSYLELVKSNDLAKVVKLADLKHNSDLSRLKTVEPKDVDRQEKYRRAIKFLST